MKLARHKVTARYYLARCFPCGAVQRNILGLGAHKWMNISEQEYLAVINDIDTATLYSPKGGIMRV